MLKAIIPVIPRVRKKKIVEVSKMRGGKKKNRLLGVLFGASFQGM